MKNRSKDFIDTDAKVLMNSYGVSQVHFPKISKASQTIGDIASAVYISSGAASYGMAMEVAEALDCAPKSKRRIGVAIIGATVLACSIGAVKAASYFPDIMHTGASQLPTDSDLSIYHG